jgi:hypothetical protein
VQHLLSKVGLQNKGWLEKIVRQVDELRSGSIQHLMLKGFYFDMLEEPKITLCPPPNNYQKVLRINLMEAKKPSDSKKLIDEGEEEVDELREELQDEMRRIEEEERKQRNKKARNRYKSKLAKKKKHPEA